MKIRYLHLSDLHLSYSEMRGDDWPVRAFNQDMVTKSMLEYIEQLLKRAGDPLDFIIITGDIARAGKREEYDVAWVFCERLLKAAGLPEKRLYLVAGNHDVNRKEVNPRHVKSWYPLASDDETQDSITGLLTDPDLLPILMRKFTEFNYFAEKAMGRRHYDEKTYHLVESLALDKGGNPVKVALMGLNSALFAGYDGDDKQRLALGLYQVDRALEQLDEAAIMSIGFFHHPFSAFHPVEKVTQNRLIRRLDLILTGHLHEPSNAFARSEAGQAVIVGAGASFETRESRNSFNIVEIDLTTGKGEVQFYKYLHNHNRWKKDTDVNPEHDDGKFLFEIDRIARNPLKPVIKPTVAVKTEAISISEPDTGSTSDDKVKVIFIHDYLLPESFTGRKNERARLNELVKGTIDPVTKKSASLVTVKAMGGVGKSCLIRKVVEDFKEQSVFSHIIWFSFYEARTEDEGYFFRKVLEMLGVHFDKNQKQTGAPEIRRLAELLCAQLDKRPVLLILDGLEVIQYTEEHSAPGYGKIKPTYGEITKLLTHLCNQTCSRALVTTRVIMSQFDGVSGSLELSLDVMSLDEGTELLQKLGVMGTKDELRDCVKLVGGHALALKAAGIFMKKFRNYSAIEYY